MNKARFHILFVYAVYIVVLSVLQFAMPDVVSISGAKPDLLFVFPVLAGYMYGTMDAVVIGLVAGFIRDSYSGRFLGLSMLICLFCGIIASVFLKKVLSRNILLALVQVGFATLLYTVFLTALSLVFFNVTQPIVPYIVWVIQNQFLPNLLMNTLVAMALYFSLKKLGPYRVNKFSKTPDENLIGDSQWE